MTPRKFRKGDANAFATNARPRNRGFEKAEWRMGADQSHYQPVVLAHRPIA
jgi:hypothetical protein